jgi:RNase P/RNase MRP subunit p29
MATAWTVQIDVPEMTRVGVALAREEVTDTTRRVYNRAIVLTPVDTGNLRGQNKMRVHAPRGGRVTGEVFNETSYAAAVHDGHGAYTVRPKPKIITVRAKKGQALRFKIGGKTIFRRSVRMQKPLRFKIGGRVVYAQSARIPARRGRPWIYRALLEVAVPRGYKITGRP